MRKWKGYAAVVSSTFIVMCALMWSTEAPGTSAETIMKLPDTTPLTQQDKLDVMIDFIETAEDVLMSGDEESKRMTNVAINLLHTYITSELPGEVIAILVNED